MFAVLATEVNYKVIKPVILNREEEILYKAIDTELDIVEEIDKISRVGVRHLIIDISSLADFDALPQVIRKYRIRNDKTQIIIIAPNIKPGNKNMSLLVTMGVYDIICPIDDSEGFLELKSGLEKALDTPSTYARAVKWDIGYFAENENAIKPLTESKVEPIKKYEFFGKKIIGVLNLSPKSGSTFLTLCLAKAISENKIPVAVIEPPMSKADIYDTIGVDSNLEANQKYYSPSMMIEQGTDIVKDIAYFEGIYWLINEPLQGQFLNWDTLNMFKLLNASRRASVNIIDIGNYYEHKSIQELISNFDMLLVTIDPNPVSVMQSEIQLRELIELRKKGVNVQFVINKFNQGVDKKKLLEFLGISPICFVPFVELHLVYKAIYDCHVPYAVKDIKESIGGNLKPILDEIIPKDMNRVDKLGKSGLFNYFKRKG